MNLPFLGEALAEGVPGLLVGILKRSLSAVSYCFI